MRTVACLTLGLGLFAMAPEVFACSIAVGPPAAPSYPHFRAEGFPTNGVFHTGLEWRAEDGTRLTLEAFEPRSSETGLELRVPASGALPAGARFHPLEDCPTTGACEHVLAVGMGPDTTPPGQVSLSSVRTLLVEDPVGAGAFSCPDVDTLVLESDVTDDTTPNENITLLAFIGSDEEEVSNKATVDIALGSDRLGDAPGLRSTIALGVAEGRQRDGLGFSVEGPFCFSLAAMDWAGNIGPRSAPQCLDTTDPNDPTVELVDGQSCACSTPGRGTTGDAWVGLAAMLVAWATGARHRRR